MVSIGRIATNVGKLLFDSKYQTVVENTIKNSGSIYKAAGKSKFTNFGTQIKDGFIKAEQSTAGVSVWKGMKTSATSLPSDISAAWKNTTGFWKQTGAVGKELGKRLPLLGSALMVAFEIPNIYTATKDEGLVSGIFEAGKSTARLAGGAAAAAIGQAICPIPLVGGLLGWMIGDKLVSMVVGKSYSEKKEELAENLRNSALVENQAIQTSQMVGNPTFGNYPQYGLAQNFNFNGIQTMTPQQLMALRNMYQMSAMGTMNDDYMFNASGLNRLV